MTWQLFTVIQIFAVALAAGGALFLRNRALRQRNDALLELCRQAHDELVNVTTKLTAIETTAPPEKMLQERLKGMQGTDDPVVTVRRMVIENELKPAPDFPDRLVGLLASQQPDEEECCHTLWLLPRRTLLGFQSTVHASSGSVGSLLP